MQEVVPDLILLDFIEGERKEKGDFVMGSCWWCGGVHTIGKERGGLDWVPFGGEVRWVGAKKGGASGFKLQLGGWCGEGAVWQRE